MKSKRSVRAWIAICFGGSLCLALACYGLPTDGWTTTTELDRANCTMTIIESDGQAEINARFTKSIGLQVELADDQSVAVNDTLLTGPDDDHKYIATIDQADQYVITVTEPTRGVETTTVEPPAAFEITSPADGQDASLSGFTVTWSNADAACSVLVRLTQSIFGQEYEFIGSALSDSGSFTLTADDLWEGGFQQGADLTVMVTRIKEVSGINGFLTSQVSVARSQTVQLVPAP